MFAAYKRGVTPNGQGLRKETAFYGWMMEQYESMEAQVEPWFLQRKEELEPNKPKGKGARRG